MRIPESLIELAVCQTSDPRINAHRVKSWLVNFYPEYVTEMVGTGESFLQIADYLRENYNVSTHLTPRTMIKEYIS